MGIICPPSVGIRLSDLPNIGGISGPPGPPSSGITAYIKYHISLTLNQCLNNSVGRACNFRSEGRGFEPRLRQGNSFNFHNFYFCWGQQNSDKDFHLKAFKKLKSILEKKLFLYSNWKNNCSNWHYFSWTMNIQIIKNYWDMEIIGNRRKRLFL